MPSIRGAEREFIIFSPRGDDVRSGTAAPGASVSSLAVF